MKAVIVSAQRCGGLFLAGCLSNHPDIHCPREEPFRNESIWRQRLKIGLAELLDFVLSEPYYPVAMCRLTYDQAFNPEIQDYLLNNHVRIIHLLRDMMPVVTSTLLAKQEITQKKPRHYFDDSFQDDEILDATPAEVIQRIKHLERQRAAFCLRFEQARMLTVTYERMIQAPSGLPMATAEIAERFGINPKHWSEGSSTLAPREARRICSFLEIECQPMAARNRKMHQRPVKDYYRNWKEIVKVLCESFPKIPEAW